MAVTSEPNTILLMDDELFNIQWLMDYLNSIGYDVYPTSSDIGGGVPGGNS